jgi:hypothetical protein
VKENGRRERGREKEGVEEKEEEGVVGERVGEREEDG